MEEKKLYITIILSIIVFLFGIFLLLDHSYKTNIIDKEVIEAAENDKLKFENDTKNSKEIEITTKKDEDNNSSNNNEDKYDKKDNKEEKKTPTIKLEIYEGPTYSPSDNTCYYQIKATVTGNPYPTVKFSKDDSLGSLGHEKIQININSIDQTYTITAVATNSEGSATDSITLSWDCKKLNNNPEITEIIIPDTLFTGQQYDISVTAVDPDDDILTYEWNVSGGLISDNQAANIQWTTPDSAGSYTIEIKVTDGRGGEAIRSETALVSQAEQPPQDNNQDPQPPQPQNINLSKVTLEGGFIEYSGETANGSYLFAGDSNNNKPCRGFISFDITGVSGAIINSAAFKLNITEQIGSPSFYSTFSINVLNWGTNPITQSIFYQAGEPMQSFDSSGDGNITYTAEKLKEELQNAANNGKSRFQIRIHFTGDASNYNNAQDGWKYDQNNINLSIEYTP